MGLAYLLEKGSSAVEGWYSTIAERNGLRGRVLTVRKLRRARELNVEDGKVVVKVTYRFTNSLSEFLNISFEENVSVSSREAMTRKRKELRPNRFSNLLEQVGNPDGLAIISRRHEKSVADFGAKLMPYRLSANEILYFDVE